MQQNQVRRKSSGQTEMTIAFIWLEGKSRNEKTKKKRERKHKYPKTEGKSREFKQSKNEQDCIKTGNFKRSL